MTAPAAMPRSRGFPLPPWGPLALVLGLVVPTLIWASSLAVGGDASEDLSDADIIAGLIVTILVLDGALVAAPAIASFWRHKLGWSALGFRPLSRDLLWWPPAAAVGAHIAVIIYAAVLMGLGADKAAPEQENLDELVDSFAVLPLAGFATVIVAPVAEELFFRGFLFAGLARLLGATPAMIGSGLIFGMFHITSGDTVGLIIPFGAIGVLFAWLYYRSGSLWTSIGAHFLFNLVSFVILAAAAGGD